ncbi:hypothetical protein M8542_45985 [Amycolatopsis sp. OK19-0408]|uniref:Uncharacterized protein n=1 Tax=Amycolatopsis iheyensis TaxID=2945988 RepID=A0A9X2NQ66_9PSEU|nr:hypothetical protein [Amycolatopsis iheyensis]MCR6490185.1 hypothetical protein [Amycolatopsis iheyensis]
MRFFLAEQGFLTEAIAVQREAAALAEPDGRSYALWELASLQREAGDPVAAWESLRAAAAGLPAGRENSMPGLWCQVARECFSVVPLLPVEVARAAFDLGEEVLRAGPAWWMNGAVDAALAAAESLDEVEARARELRRVADVQLEAHRG